MGGVDGQIGIGQADRRPVLASLYDYELSAKAKIPLPAWEYLNSGSADEITLRRNREALDALQLKPRVSILRSELEAAMAMTGRTRLEEIDRSIFWKSRDYSS